MLEFATRALEPEPAKANEATCTRDPDRAPALNRRQRRRPAALALGRRAA